MRALLFWMLSGLAALPASAENSRAVKATEQQAIEADARANALRQQADAADIKARRARFDAIGLARRIQEGEARAIMIEGRIAALQARARDQRSRLAAKQGDISRLLAALQTMGRRPAGLVLLEPKSAIETARVSALLAAVRPLLAERTAALRAELDETRRLQTALAAARRQLAASETALAASIASLDALQATERQARDRFDAEADAEQARARRLASKAIDLRGLAQAMEADGRRLAPDTPAVLRARAASGFTYVSPAAGTIRQGFGRRDSVGVRARGLTLATRDNAQVTAPAGGRVAYAGPFRAYGDIVIIAHDDTMLSLISGMERVDVVVGETVAAGTPIGRMGSVQPELYLELRRGGTPVDPAVYMASRG